MSRTIFARCKKKIRTRSLQRSSPDPVTGHAGKESFAPRQGLMAPTGSSIARLQSVHQTSDYVARPVPPVFEKLRACIARGKKVAGADGYPAYRGKSGPIDLTRTFCRNQAIVLRLPAHPSSPRCHRYLVGLERDPNCVPLFRDRDLLRRVCPTCKTASRVSRSDSPKLSCGAREDLEGRSGRSRPARLTEMPEK